MLNGLPDFLYQQLHTQYDMEIIKKILAGYAATRKTTFRVNTLKATVKEVKDVLDKNSISYEQPDWYADAFILKEANETIVRRLTIYEEGKIYLQSLSSMIPALLLKPQSNENILDMAAAPGGKTTQMAALSSNAALITACEKNKIRAERLQYNIAKQGATRITVLNEDARKLSDYFSFDKVLLDSPCSGSGILYPKENGLEKQFSKEWLTRLIKTQQALLQKAITVLKPGHEMVYSTCSILKEENEENIQKVLSKNQVEIVPIPKTILQELPRLPSSLPNVVTICPTELYEGFFVAILRKK